MHTARLGALALSFTLLACGDDGGTKLIDSGMRIDSGPKVCSTALSFGTFDIQQYDKDSGYIAWFADINGMLSDGTEMQVLIDFYPAQNGAPIGTGPIDLATGGNENYATCRVCVLAIGGTQQAPKYYFQRSGTITLTEDPLATQNFKATISNLVLEQVDIDGDTFMSTPIPTGDCANIPEVMVDADRVPAAYTCTPDTYDTAPATGFQCNCQCGLYEPDCFLKDAPVMGCSNNQVCAYEETAGTQCVAKPANDTCATAGTALTLGVAVNGTTLGADNHYDNGLGGATCMDYPDHDGDDVVYQVALTGGTNYSVQLTTTLEVDFGVAIVGPGAAGTVCVEDPGEITTCIKGIDRDPSDPSVGTYDETFTVMPTTTGTYFVIIDSYSPFHAGAFTLTVSQL